MKSRPNLAHVLYVTAGLALLAAAAAWFCLDRGYVLYFGDAEAHLNIARRIVDSRTPGPEQIGTVWLPLPHLVLLPFAMCDDLWRSGAAGAIPSAICFVLAGAFLFAAARRAYRSELAALAATMVFAINPNMLYLAATPMTEALFAASLAALLWATLWFRDSQSVLAILAAGIASNAASLTRYEGWFLIPFVSAYLLFAAKMKWHAILFGAIAALGPLAWLAHNRFYYGNALEFYNGPWSAMAIYKRALDSGMARYPGDHDWRSALHYYFAAAQAVAGWPVLALGAVGAIAALIRKAWWPLALLALPPAFYIWSMHSSGTPIFVPNLWPNSYYNTRYAIAIVPLAAFAAAAMIPLSRCRGSEPRPQGSGNGKNRRDSLRLATLAAIVVIAATSWISTPICWKESEVNSITRRAWTAQAATYLAQNYQPGSGIMFPFGDITGVLREAGIPLREGLHEGNGPAWIAAVMRPDLFLHEEWAIGFSGDEVATAMQRAGHRGKHYLLVQRIRVKNGPIVQIWRRE